MEKNTYGKKSMGIRRSTFVIDEDGNVAKAMLGVKPDNHADVVLAALPAWAARTTDADRVLRPVGRS